MLNQLNNSVLGLNIVGHVSCESGLGEGLRSILRPLESLNIPFTLKDIKVFGHSHLDSSYTADSHQKESFYPINIIHTNPNLFEDPSISMGSAIFINKYNIGYWAWEVENFPEAWKFAFDFFDEIWTPSNFCVESLSTGSPIPIIKIPHSIFHKIPSLDRQKLGLPEKKFIFLFMFDFWSRVERKNPYAIIKAFQKAFTPENADVQLIIKCSSSQFFPQEIENLKNSVKNWSSIQFIEGNLRKEEVNALIYNCDCYVSLHRSEGFGLTMAEAMFYGKPVIATAYSGNLDFMNISNSFLVKYKRVLTEEYYHPFPKGSIWADPDIDHAASLMQYVFYHYPEAQQVGAKASDDIRYSLNIPTVGKKILKRLELISEMVNNEGASSQIHQLKQEKEWWKSKYEAWKLTAEKLQKELAFLKNN